MHQGTKQKFLFSGSTHNEDEDDDDDDIEDGLCHLGA